MELCTETGKLYYTRKNTILSNGEQMKISELKAGATNVTLVEADQILSNCRYYKGRPTKRYGRMKKMEEKVLKNIELRSARTNERFQKFMDQYNKFIQKETRKLERLEREAQEYLRRRSMDQAADGKSGFLVDQGTGPKSP